jgi:ABC-type transport system involved in multi-copper enzyme maturation permease subunit
MTWLRLVRGEIRKLTSTKMPLGFLVVLVVIAGIDAAVVAFGTEMDGSKAFIATAADQKSLMAFAANAMLGTALFGAIAVAREYGHGTVVPTFLMSPRRPQAVLAQLTAVLVAGAVLGVVGEAMIIGGVALALPSTEYGFMVGAGDLTQLFAASMLAGAVGAVLGAGLGAVIRNLGGAVTTAVLVLFVLPPLAVQLVNDSVDWIPSTLFAVISGVNTEVGTEVGLWAALVAVTAWALVPAAAGLMAVERRDVV